MAGKGCWTCKERKIQCDRSLPTCRKCSRSRRKCHGYGLRLSWPNTNDKKRWITGIVLPSETQQGQTIGKLFINTTFEDVKLYHLMSLQSAAQRAKPLQHVPKLWKQPQLQVKHMDLLQYFHESAYLSLVLFKSNNSQTRDMLMSMAMAHNSIPAHALFYALIAYSSLHRHGLHQDTIKFKVAALHALSTSAELAANGPVEAARHVATCMLLCAFEILLPSDSSGDWLWYIHGAMEIVQQAPLGEHSDQGEMANLADWVYYHHTLSRFTMYHWRHDSVASGATDTKVPDLRGTWHSSLAKHLPPPKSQNATHEILFLLSEVCEVLRDPSDPRSREEGYKDRLKTLEWKINNLAVLTSTSDPSAKKPAPLSTSVEFYQLATLLYLKRASQSPWDLPSKADYLIDRAFAGPIQSPACGHFFPLFIIACEAHTDERRLAILQLIERSEKGAYGRSMKMFRAEIKSFWVQQDLHADGDLMPNYLRLMENVISANKVLPSYA